MVQGGRSGVARYTLEVCRVLNTYKKDLNLNVAGFTGERKLFDFIEGLMGSYRCHERLAYTSSFLAKHGISLEDHIDFFEAHQVELDYEVVTILEPKFPVDENEFERRKIL